MSNCTAWLACAALAFSAVANAEENDTGIAFALGYGPTTIEDTDGPGDSFDGSDFGYNFDLEWRIARYFAIGMNFLDLGEDSDQFNGEDTSIGVTGLGFYVRGYLPLDNGWTLNAHFGGTNYSTDIDPGGGTVFPFSDNADDYGIGVDYSFTDNWSVRLQHRWLDGPSQEFGSLSTIGVRYQF